ncbi:unnamed protein product [Brassica oleracea var. botrytis]|nr:unnamed protein product [Brassica oleracea]
MEEGIVTISRAVIGHLSIGTRLCNLLFCVLGSLLALSLAKGELPCHCFRLNTICKPVPINSISTWSRTHIDGCTEWLASPAT